MNYEVCFLYADKHWILSFWLSVTRHAQSTQNKFAYLYNISIKTSGMKLSFWPTGKHKTFLHDGSIILGVISQTGPKCQKQSDNNIFAISQRKHKWWSWFFVCWKILKVFSNWYYTFRYVDMPGRHVLIT